MLNNFKNINSDKIMKIILPLTPQGQEVHLDHSVDISSTDLFAVHAWSII